MIGTILRIRYELVTELGTTPIFAVYKARDRVQGRDVLIRVFQEPFSHEPSFIQAMGQVVAKTHSIQHPQVERLIELDEHEGTSFLVSEFVAGQVLEDRLRKLAPFSPAVATATAVSILEALDGIHSEGLVHGDINSKNVWITPDGKARLMLPMLWESFHASRTAGMVSLPDMAPGLAPEVTEGAMPSVQSDLYAVGALLFELLIGRTPFSGDTPMAMAVKHTTAPVPSLRSQSAAIPQALEDVVKKLLAKSPSDRYLDTKSALADLRTLQDAMRFGKPVNFAPNYKPTAGSSKSKSVEPEPEPQAVAPRLNNVEETQRPVKKKRERRPDGLPIFLVVLGYAAALAVVAVIGSFLYFNLNKPKQVTVPNLVGMSMNEASQMIEPSKLKLQIVRREVSEKYAEGVIMDVNPSPGRKVYENSSLSVIISTGSKFVTVPDLRGRTLDDAKMLLAQLGLELQEPVRTVTSRDLDPGTVKAQQPAARTKVERFTRVRLDVVGERGSRASETPQVDPNQRFLYTLRIRIPEQGSVPITVRVERLDAESRDTVHEQVHEPGEEFTVEAEAVGPEATFFIYFDGELVKQVNQKAADAQPLSSEPTGATP